MSDHPQEESGFDRFRDWIPQLALDLRHYSRADFVADLSAGLSVGLVALPLSMAFGIASGATPAAGLYTAVVGGFLVSALGGSKTQIGGPAGAFVALVFSIISRYGLDGMLTALFLAGLLLILMGVSGLGRAVRFLPLPMIIGLTNGFALIILSTQLKDFFGIPLNKVPAEFLPRLIALAEQASTLQWPTLGLGLGSVVIMLVWPRIPGLRRFPSSLVAVLAGTLGALMLELPADTIGSRFGGIPSGFPWPSLPHLRLDLIPHVFPAAISLAILGSIESLLSAVVADSMTGSRHNPNTELIAQGIANVASSTFGGIPVTGVIARTATNSRLGARTPMAGVIHALVLLAILVLFGPYAKYIPLATLAGILVVVAISIGDWREVPAIFRLGKTDLAIWATTLLMTLLVDVSAAVQAGMVLAAMLYIYRVSETSSVSLVTADYIELGRAHILQDKEIPPYVSILRIHGPFLFGTTEKLAELTADLEALRPIVIVRMRNMTALDSTGLHALESLHDRLTASGRQLLLCGANYQPRRLMHRAEFVDHVGAENILPHVEAALERARDLYARGQ